MARLEPTVWTFDITSFDHGEHGFSEGDPLPYKMVDSPEAVTGLIDELLTAGRPSPTLFIDLEGVELSRRGSISLIQICAPHAGRVFLVDVYKLGSQAFSITGSAERTLKSVLESDRIIKYFFDVRNDSDALFSLFDIRLAGVRDVQLLELATRTFPKDIVCSLLKCIERDCPLSSAKKEKWVATKREVTAMFDPNRGGSYEVFNTRPLPPAIVTYCAQDVQYLPLLAATYESRISRQWAGEVALETHRRLLESRAPEYEPKGDHKKFGPRSWCSQQKNGGSRTHRLLKRNDNLFVGTTSELRKSDGHIPSIRVDQTHESSTRKLSRGSLGSSTVVSRTIPKTEPAGIRCDCGKTFKSLSDMAAHRRDAAVHKIRDSGPIEACSSLSEGQQTLLVEKIKKGAITATSEQSQQGSSGANGRLWRQPVHFVKEGDTTHRETRQQRGSATQHNTRLKAAKGRYFSDMLEDQDWALCDKDCAWCGHCGDGIL